MTKATSAYLNKPLRSLEDVGDKQMTHTPGPWAFRPSPDNDERYWIDGPIGLTPMIRDEKIGPPIANTALRPSITESEANARLIASAPDLLATLKKIAELQDDKCQTASAEMLYMLLDMKVGIARAAIEKATQSRN